MAKIRNIGIALLVCMGAAFVVLVVLRGYSWYWGLIVGGILTALYAWRELTFKPPVHGAAQPAAPQQAGTVHDVGRSALTAVVVIDIALYLACAIWVPGLIMKWAFLATGALLLLNVRGWIISPEQNTVAAEFFFGHLVLGRSVREGWQIQLFRGWFRVAQAATYPEAVFAEVIDGPDVWTAPVDPNAALPEGASDLLAKIHKGQVLLDIALSLQLCIKNAALFFRKVGLITLPAQSKEGGDEKSDTETSERDQLSKVLATKISQLTGQIAQGAMLQAEGKLTIDEALGGKKPDALKEMEAYIEGECRRLGLGLVFIDYGKLAVGERYRQARERAAEEEAEANALHIRRLRYLAFAQEEVDKMFPGLKDEDPEQYMRVVSRVVRQFRLDDLREKLYDFGMLGGVVEAFLLNLRKGKKKGEGKGDGDIVMDDEDEEDRSGGSRAGSRRGGR